MDQGVTADDGVEQGLRLNSQRTGCISKHADVFHLQSICF
jgi:hypothetical protein